MSSSLLAGVSGLQANQETLDVVGNNLANLNTTGFKSQSAEFSDLLYQTLAPASSSSNGGGTNPIQVGYGVTTATMASNFSQGALTTTGGPLDLAIQGQGFFVANNGTQNVYTRGGSLNIDASGFLVDPSTGFRIQRYGTVGEATASSPGFQTPGVQNIQIPMGTGIAGQATADVTLQGNLSSTAVGPLAQTLTSASPFLQTGGAPATTATALNSLADNQAPYAAGDSIVLSGTTATGTTVNYTMPVSATTTLNDVINAINTNFPGSTASLTSGGNLVVQAAGTGPSKLNLMIADSPGDAGASSWNTHGFQITTSGKDGDTVSGGVQVFDSQGTPHNLSLTFTKQGNNTWSLTAGIPATDGTMVTSTIPSIVFNDDGSLRQISGSGTLSFQINGLSKPQTLTLNFGTPNGFNGLTQFGGQSSAAAVNQDGYAAGSLNSVSVSQDGTINGIFSNGRIFPLAQLAIASFSNPEGLNRLGSNYYSMTVNSGVALVAGAQAGGRGSIQDGALEESNVNVSLEFTKLITAQQGYEVNARSITVSSQVLQALANIIQ